jgi:hypothetical protein
MPVHPADRQGFSMSSLHFLPRARAWVLGLHQRATIIVLVLISLVTPILASDFEHGGAATAPAPASSERPRLLDSNPMEGARVIGLIDILKPEQTLFQADEVQLRIEWQQRLWPGWLEGRLQGAVGRLLGIMPGGEISKDLRLSLGSPLDAPWSITADAGYAIRGEFDFGAPAEQNIEIGLNGKVELPLSLPGGRLSGRLAFVDRRMLALSDRRSGLISQAAYETTAGPVTLQASFTSESGSIGRSEIRLIRKF